ncbi:MAG: nucleoside triphosphate pyrophosphohydrolase [Candidatus Gastranaerophilaceae bacterium]|jgi:tetrapyrrole methylase family protein/MazG family protein
MNKDLENINLLIDVIAKLRSPDGCPWDREQTHYSLKQNFLEETYEAVDAIDDNNIDNLKEELGDVLLQVVLHSQIASERNDFNIGDVAEVITQKLIRRHPHVFADVKVSGTDEVLVNWDKIKRQEKPERKTALCGISKSQPALMSAFEISKKAVKVGFEWPNAETLQNCVYSELEEFKEAVELKNSEKMEEELGDILFSIVNLARWNKIHPETALMKANKKFISRFKKMEELAIKELTDYTFEEFDELWKTAKSEIEKVKNNVH